MMRLSKITIKDFRRFTDLQIVDLPSTTRLVILAGPNGCGKSSLFDAFQFFYHQHGLGLWNDFGSYYAKPTPQFPDGTFTEYHNRVLIEAHGGENIKRRASFYFRSAYRNDPEFVLNSLERIDSRNDENRVRRMIETDATVGINFRRLASQALADVFSKESPSTTIGDFRDRIIGGIRDRLQRLFPGLELKGIGNPLEGATFRFDKGVTKDFHYQKLSSGEKAAFDLILDIEVKKSVFQSAVYCIDEPESHLNSRLQAELLAELYDMIPQQSQLWVATHSIGMMRKARELMQAFPGTVTFLDFEDHDFDRPTIVVPTVPTRIFWERVFRVALDDLAALVVPAEVVICEGNPAGSPGGKNAEHDARVYDTIFRDEFPHVKFVSSGNSSSVATDRLAIASVLQKLTPGVMIRRIIDRDDHTPADVAQMAREGITVLSRRHIESYLYDDEVLTALCTASNKPEEAPALIADKQRAVADSQSRGNPADDIKSAAGTIYVKAKQRLGLTGAGNDPLSFARNTLAPLLKPGMATYTELRNSIFST